MLRLLDIFQIKGSKKVVLSFAFEEGGDLGKLLHRVRHLHHKATSVRSKLKYKGLPPFVVCHLGAQLLKGIQHMHSKGWIHRDLKPANLLLSEPLRVSELLEATSRRQIGKQGESCDQQTADLKLRIGDFGLAKMEEFPLVMQTKEIMTLWYRAPEVLLDNLCYNKAIDLWSAGVIIFEMLTGEYLFRATSEIELIIKILQLKGTPLSEAEAEAERLELAKTNTQRSASRKKWHEMFEQKPSDAASGSGRPVLKRYESYPHLNKYGLKLPLFKTMPLTDHCPALKDFDPAWVKLIDGLTDLDPFQRLTPKQAIFMLS